eukprot:8585091-Alexandrium_andersonii.AAC.1
MLLGFLRACMCHAGATTNVYACMNASRAVCRCEPVCMRACCERGPGECMRGVCVRARMRACMFGFMYVRGHVRKRGSGSASA